MKFQPKCVLRFCVLIAFVSLATDALGSCPTMDQGPPCWEYWRTQAVFIGTVNRVVNTPNNTGLAMGPYVSSTVYFTVDEAFKGVEGTGTVVNMDHCGYRFKEGERYLVYAHRNPNNNELDVRAGNTRTRPLSEAAEDLAYIRGLASAEPGSKVFGKVVQQTHNLKANRFEVEPLPKVKITLEGNNQLREVVTDSEGRYEIKGIAAGTYRVHAEIPAGFRRDELTIKVSGRECVPLDIAARSKGEIAGRVVDVNGKPLDSVPVSLVPADVPVEQILSEGKWITTWTDKQGRYWFNQLAPDRYLLIVNRTEQETSLGSDLLRSLPRLFYPGVSDLSGATVIVVGKDDEPRELEFRLPVQQ
jgi:hypothetical protein